MKGPKKLRVDALSSDIAAVESLIAKSREYGDRIGEFQFKKRKVSLEAELEALQGVAEHTGHVAVYFGGGPVLGSRGIEADFAGEALQAFQEIIQKQLAIEDGGGIAARGPIPNRAASQLLITDVARGSFGFMLEEAAAGEALSDTQLKHVLEQSGGLISDIASPNTETFEAALGSLDERTLIALKKFFAVLDKEQATLRLVGDESEFVLQRADVTRARHRVEETEIAEDEVLERAGRLYFLPDHKTFELFANDGEKFFGKVDLEVMRYLTAAAVQPGMTITAGLKVKRVQQRGRGEKVYYRLAAVSDLRAN